MERSADPSVAGAFINVYAASPTELAAVDIAKREIADAGWHAHSIDRVVRVTRSDYAEDAEHLRYFEQALTDGVIVVIHTFPPEPSESDAIH